MLQLAFFIMLFSVSSIEPIEAKALPCYLVKAAILVTGSEEAAAKVAIQRGYSQADVEAARRKCLINKKDGR